MEGVDQAVDFGGDAVHVERCPGGGRDVEQTMERPGAVMARPYRHTLLIEDGGEIVRVDVGEREADCSAP